MQMQCKAAKKIRSQFVYVYVKLRGFGIRDSGFGMRDLGFVNRKSKIVVPSDYDRITN